MLRFGAHHLLPAVGGGIELGPVHLLREDGAGRVVDRDALAIRCKPVSVGNARAGRGPVPGEDDVVVLRDRIQVGNFAVGRVEHLQVGQLELLDRILNPDIAEALPRGDRRGACAQHRPHRAFERASVGARHDADEIVVGHAQQLFREVDRVFQARLADRRTVRAAQRFGFECVERPAGELGGRTGRKERTLRTERRLGSSHVFSPCRELARRWDRVARRPH